MPDNDNFLSMPPGVAQAIREQFEIDYAEAGPKAPVDSFSYKGIKISSRWAVLSEFETMKRAIDALNELMARRLSRIWCDSNCTANYVVGVKPRMFISDLKWEINDAFRIAGGGHNGILIEEGGDGPFEGRFIVNLDPDWGEWDGVALGDLLNLDRNEGDLAF